MNDPVVITGISVVTSLGNDPTKLVERLRAGETGFSPYQAPSQDPAAEAGELAGALKPFPAEGLDGLYGRAGDAAMDFAKVQADLVQLLGGTGWRHYLRASLMCCLAARNLWEATKATTGERLDPQELGLVVGNSLNAFVKAFIMAMLNRELRCINPAVFLNNSTNAPASQAAMLLEAQGFVVTLTSGFTAGLEALDVAGQALQAGRARMVLAGASEEEIPEIVQSFKHVYTPRCESAAFPARAKGTPGSGWGLLDGGQPGAVLTGEGCSLLQLELESRAQNRHARIRGWLQGFGMGVNLDAKGKADPAAMRSAIGKALAEAGVQPGDIDAVFLAANGNPNQDAAEAEALVKIFGDKLPPAAALKGALGETLHAGGALAVASAILCLEQGFLPPTRRLVSGELARKLRVSEACRPLQARRVLVLAMEEDFKAAALVIGMPEKK
jgi:3-oxoacyl-(acyl-carrier-protein) synthase